MNSRERILNTIKKHQPIASPLPELVNYDQQFDNKLQKYIEVLQFIGGQAYLVSNYEQIKNIIEEVFPGAQRIVTTCTELQEIAESKSFSENPHSYANVDLFITTSDLAIAENGALWINDKQLPSRVLPFIAQQVAVIIKRESIVATMHEAYDAIANTDYNYAVFIAGPSKTADIAQSLVLGAHGPKGMIVFIM